MRQFTNVAPDSDSDRLSTIMPIPHDWKVHLVHYTVRTENEVTSYGEPAAGPSQADGHQLIQVRRRGMEPAPPEHRACVSANINSWGRRICQRKVAIQVEHP